MDVVANGTNCSNAQAPQYAAILTKMGATNVASAQRPSHGPPTSPPGLPTRGGSAAWAPTPRSRSSTSGASAGPRRIVAAGEVTLPVGSNTTTGGTHPAGASALIVADGIVQYLKSPGPLV